MQPTISFRISSVQIFIEDIEVFIVIFQKIEAFIVFTWDFLIQNKAFDKFQLHKYVTDNSKTKLSPNITSLIDNQSFA